MKTASDHPYYIFPAMRELKTRYAEMSPARADALKQQVAMNVHCPRAAAMYIDLGGDDWLHIYPPKATETPVSTENVIDTFLDIYSPAAKDSAEIDLLERLIFNPTPDYASVLEKQEAEAAGKATAAADVPAAADTAASAPELTASGTGPSQDAMIASFLSAYPGKPTKATAAPPERAESAERPQHTESPENNKNTQNPENAQSPRKPETPLRAESAERPQGIQSSQKSLGAQSRRRDAAPHAATLSESLARIFIKQGRYRQAFDIISELNLNYPEKSIYFADQMRFLRRLIAIEEARNKRANSVR